MALEPDLANGRFAPSDSSQRILHGFYKTTAPILWFDHVEMTVIFQFKMIIVARPLHEIFPCVADYFVFKAEYHFHRWPRLIPNCILGPQSKHLELWVV